MASLIPGYNYDIFISYRQKDNKYDGWVTEFVDKLKMELEATFKEDVSVYFDINPHDGLLETHDVNESLKEKLKCLIFIPIISRTYCDPKSFAWEHEFKVFAEQASNDQLGLKIKLPNGNVASRILPISIYNLDSSDIDLCESVLGGVLRGIDFIYEEHGVNRPLKPDDDERINLKKTKYRNQINKVGNAIKEIITAIKLNDPGYNEIIQEVPKRQPTAQKKHKSTIVPVLVIALTLVTLGIIFIPKLFNPPGQVEMSIAVLPFRNLSNDTTQLYFCDGFMEEILNNLQKIQSFTVRSRTSTDQYRNSKKSIKVIGDELNVNYLVEGSVQREGNNMKIWVQLIDTKADEHLWSNDYTREISIEQIFSLQSEIARSIATALKAVLTQEEIENIEKRPTENLDAYNYYLQANYFYFRGNSAQNYRTAIELYEKATELDPEFASAYSRIGICYLAQYWMYTDRSEDLILKSKQAIDKAFELDPDLTDANLALGYYYYWGFLNYQQALDQTEIILGKQPGNSEVFVLRAAILRRSGNWELAKECFEKACELDPRSANIIFNTGETFDLAREYSTALQYYRKAITLQPDWIDPYIYLSRMYLRSEEDTRKAKELLANAIQNNNSFLSDSLLIETNVIINIYDGKYQEALKDLGSYKSDVFQMQFYYIPKSLYYATVYGLMNQHELELTYYDSARIFLEERIEVLPGDPRMLSSLGIAYAGLGLRDKALDTGIKAEKLLPISKEAYKGVFIANDLALIHIMLGNYDEAIEEIKHLLSIPGSLTTKIINKDPRWASLKDHSEYKELLKEYTAN